MSEKTLETREEPLKESSKETAGILDETRTKLIPLVINEGIPEINQKGVLGGFVLEYLK